MDKVEELMAAYPDLHFIFDKNMPDGQQGLYIDHHIYLNPDQSQEDLLSTIGEEIGHYLTSAGDITAQDTNEKRKQERKARDIGSAIVVTPYDIIACFEEGCKTLAACADFLGVPPQTSKDAVTYYARRFDGIKTEENYTLFFHIDGTIEVVKTFGNQS
ncbi:ImmA/IrrE family metallo-endopeptidase [Enterococcus casseliflavus]|uniref:ImmA/IrrE family metallo-endopeptidase n=1 Tax=Enterococcus casseliflavus TaxID=37734 RepID=UPI0039A56D94